MELITVKLVDVYPLEDEYGNQFASRDYSKPENKAYVQELAKSMRAKGQPDEPIVVVRDGGIYRIKAGNSRVMAMRELGTKECLAFVDDEDTPQSILETVIRTDVKKKYENLEMSRFVQQLFLFNKDDVSVSETTGIEKKNVGRIRRAVKVVKDASEDMTLDRLLAIEEFADDPEAVEVLTNCTEDSWRWKVEGLRRKRKNAELIAELEAEVARLAEDGDIVLFEDEAAAEEAGYANAWISVPSVGTLNSMRAQYPDYAYTWMQGYEGKVLRMFKKKDGSDEVDPAEMEEAARLSEICTDVLADADAWYGGIVASGDAAKCGRVSEMCADAFRQEVMVDYHNDWKSIDNDDSPFRDACEMPLSAADYALGWLTWSPEDELTARQFLEMKKGGANHRTRDDALYMLDFLEVLAESGYPGNKDAMEIMGVLEDYRDGGDEGE